MISAKSKQTNCPIPLWKTLKILINWLRIFWLSIGLLLDFKLCLLDTLLNILKMWILLYFLSFYLFWFLNAFILLISLEIRGCKILVINIKIMIIINRKLLLTSVCTRLYLLKYFMLLLKLLGFCKLFLLLNGYTADIWLRSLELCIYFKEYLKDGLKLFIL